jgi:serine/alanine adding enzyme
VSLSMPRTDYRIVTDAQAIDRAQWEQFVYDHPQGNVFQTPQMYAVYGAAQNYLPFVVAYYEGDSLLGFLLAVVQKEHRGLLGQLSARSIIWGGPLVRDHNLAVLKALMNEYDRAIKKQAIYTQIRNLFPMDREKGLLQELGYPYEEHLDILIDLDKPVDVLWKELHPTRRKQIERGYRRGVVFVFCQQPDRNTLMECYDLLCSLYKRIKLPFPKQDFFQKSLQHLSERIGVFVLKYQGEIIGCRFVLLYKNMIYDWYAGSNDKALDKYPNDILPWEVIKWGAENGYKVFQFGGAGKPGIPYGVRDHKLKFGGALVNYGRFEKVHMATLMRAAKVGLKVWRKFA